MNSCSSLQPNEGFASRFAMSHDRGRRRSRSFCQSGGGVGHQRSGSFPGTPKTRRSGEGHAKCTVFVLPSRYEGLGCVYLEAMACGKPAIACRGRASTKSFITCNNGWLIPVDGLEELVQALQVLLGNSELRARIGEAARRTILDGLTLSHQARKLMSIYEGAAR